MTFPRTVGVAPGTVTFRLNGPDTRARIRWDLIGLIGGGSALVALLAGLIASK